MRLSTREGLFITGLECCHEFPLLARYVCGMGCASSCARLRWLLDCVGDVGSSTAAAKATLVPAKTGKIYRMY